MLRIAGRFADRSSGGGNKATNALAIVPPVWTEDALCPQVDPAIFFPAVGGSIKDALGICEQCPVTSKCLEYALEYESTYGTMSAPSGIYGGTTPRNRAKILRDRRKAAS